MTGLWTLAVLGGDRREAEAARLMAAAGHRVATHGLPPAGTHGARTAGAEAVSAEAVLSLLPEVDAVLGPVQGTDREGRGLHRPEGALPVDPAWPERCRPGTPWLLGACGPWLSTALAARGLPLLQYAGDEDFATLNAVPTAEGAIAESGRLGGRTVWGQQAVVLGGGRCAQALALRLRLWGADVSVATRDTTEAARIGAAGARTVPWARRGEALAAATLVFNTVPAPVLGEHDLRRLPPGAVVVDVATAPGGTDFGAATRAAVPAVLLSGIPGRLYPLTAGWIVADTWRRLLRDWHGGGA